MTLERVRLARGSYEFKTQECAVCFVATRRFRRLAVGCWLLGSPGRRSGRASTVASARGCVRVRRARGLRLAKIYTDNSRVPPVPARAARRGGGFAGRARGSTAVHARHARAYASGNRICFRQRRPSERWSLKLVSPLLLLLALRPLVRVGRGRTTFNTCESLGHFFQLVLVGLMLLPNALERVTGRGQLL